MKRSYLHLLIDALLFLAATGLVLTGLLLEFVLPAGSRQAEVWTWSRHDWGELHFWIAVTILSLGLVHLLLNWGWVCSVIAGVLRLESKKPTLRRQLWAGLATVMVISVLVGGFLYAAETGKTDDSQDRGAGRGRGQGQSQIDRDLEDLFLDER